MSAQKKQRLISTVIAVCRARSVKQGSRVTGGQVAAKTNSSSESFTFKPQTQMNCSPARLQTRARK
jgi:hypothetical protein